MPGRGLLNTATSIVDGFDAKFHHVEGIDDRDGVGQLVIDGVLIPTERIECGVLDPGPKPWRLSFEPITVDRPGSARHHIEESSIDAA